MDMTLWDAEQQQHRGSAHGLRLPRSPWLPSACLGGKPTLCGLLWFTAGEMLLLEGYHHSSLKLEAEQATGWIEGGWRVGLNSEIQMNYVQPQGENFAALTGASFFPFLLTLLEIATFGIPGYYKNCSTAFMGRGFPRSTGRGLKGRAGNGRDELEELISSQAVQTLHS